MATRSNIGFENENGTIQYVYSHFDGDFNGVGRVLLKNYNSKDLAQQLVLGGDMSFPGEPYTARGEKYEDLKPRETEDPFETCQEEYSYIWTKENVWVACDCYGDKNFIPLNETSAF